MHISSAIVAHPSREQQAEKLAAELGGQVCMDTNRVGPGANHDLALILAATDEDADWIICCEDDAILVDDFHIQVENALAHCPTNVASLYLGRNNPARHQHHIGAMLQHDPMWIVHDELRHAVCVAIKPHLVTPLLTVVQNVWHLPADYRWGFGLRQLGQPIAYSNPSLVDHADDEPVITTKPNGQPRTRTKPRTAWNVGGRDVWTDQYLTL